MEDELKVKIIRLYENTINKEGQDFYDCNTEQQYNTSKSLLESKIRDYKIKLSSLSSEYCYIYDMQPDRVIEALSIMCMIDFYEKKLFNLQVDYRLLTE